MTGWDRIKENRIEYINIFEYIRVPCCQSKLLHSPLHRKEEQRDTGRGGECYWGECGCGCGGMWRRGIEG